MRKSLPMILIRVIVGVVFLTEGILKFVYPGELGIGTICAHRAAVSARACAVCRSGGDCSGWALILGFYAGDAALLLLIVILTAILTTKVPILLGHPLGRFAPPRLDHYGLLSFIHEARTDLSMLFGLVAILIDSGVKVSLRGR